MIRREKMEALVVSRRNSGEADRLVTLFTRDHGLVKAIAKGVRKIPSHRGGHLEPFTLVLAMISIGRAGTYVAGVETVRYYAELQVHDAALLHAQNMSLVLRGLFTEGDVQPTLFDALDHAWRMLPVVAPHQRGLLEIATTLHAFQCAGMAPQLSACQVCGAKYLSEAVVLHAASGGWQCLSCHGGFEGTQYSLPPRLVKVLRYLQVYPDKALRIRMNLTEVDQLLVAMRHYISHALSKPLLAEQPHLYAR